MKSHNFLQPNAGNSWHEPYFTPATPRLWETPATGSIDICDRFSPRVRFAGTLWAFKICGSGSPPPTLIHRLPVTIIGRQGNRLLIRL